METLPSSQKSLRMAYTRTTKILNCCCLYKVRRNSFRYLSSNLLLPFVTGPVFFHGVIVVRSYTLLQCLRIGLYSKLSMGSCHQLQETGLNRAGSWSFKRDSSVVIYSVPYFSAGVFCEVLTLQLFCNENFFLYVHHIS